MCTEKYKVCTEYSMSNREKDGKKIQQSLGTEQSYLVIDSFVFVYRKIFRESLKMSRKDVGSLYFNTRMYVRNMIK